MPIRNFASFTRELSGKSVINVLNRQRALSRSPWLRKDSPSRKRTESSAPDEGRGWFWVLAQTRPWAASRRMKKRANLHPRLLGLILGDEVTDFREISVSFIEVYTIAYHE